MKVLILDPALHSMGGHHYNAALRIQIELSKMHVDHVCLGSAFADDHVVQTLSVERCFSRSVYGRSDWTSKEFEQSVAITGRELSRALRWSRTTVDLMLLPCCDQVLILALAKYLRRLTLRRLPHIVLWLLFAPHYKKAIDDPATAALFGEYRQAFAALRASVHDDMKITVYCETSAMAEVYRTMIGLKIRVAPGPNLIRPGDAVQKRDRVQVPTVACTGHANAPKGYRLLLGALERVLHERVDIKFIIHGAIHDTDIERDTEIFEALAKMGPQVVVHQGVLSQEDYLSWLRKADLVLLPYDPLVYKTRGSGVFTEATTLGIPLVVTRGCGFAQPAFTDGRAVEIAEYNCDGVAKAVMAALDRLDDLTARARACISDGDVESVLRCSLTTIQATRKPRAASLFRRLFNRS